jgi:hypothetical protein
MATRATHASRPFRAFYDAARRSAKLRGVNGPADEEYYAGREMEGYEDAREGETGLTNRPTSRIFAWDLSGVAHVALAS